MLTTKRDGKWEEKKRKKLQLKEDGLIKRNYK